MTHPVSVSLDTIDAGLRRLKRTRTVELLQPGLPPSRVRRSVEACQLRSAPGLTEIYTWHDGTDATSGARLDDLYLFPGFYFLSLSDAIANYEAFKDDSRWDSSWFPICANGGGDFLAAVCEPQHNGWGEVVHFRIEQAEHPTEYASIAALCATVAAAYDEGIYYVDPRGYLEMDDKDFVALASRLNAELAYWQRCR